METKEQLTEQLRQIQHKLNKIRHAEDIAENRQFVGLTYKYRNAYSSDRKWWLYMKVKRIDKNGDCETFEFQTDDNGQLTVGFSVRHGLGPKAFQPISQREFDREWAKVQAKVKACRP